MSPRFDLPLEQLLARIGGLDRAGCVALLRAAPGLRLDFTDEYLAGQSLEALRHLAAAAAPQAQRHLRDAG